jgi:hypothetical protein
MIQLGEFVLQVIQVGELFTSDSDGRVFFTRDTLPFKIGHPMRHGIKLYEFGRIDFEITACNHYTFLFNHHLIKMETTSDMS